MSTFGTTIGGHFILDDVNCTGNESNIFDCPHPLNTDCTVLNREEAGVICGGMRNIKTLASSIMFTSWYLIESYRWKVHKKSFK